MSLKIAENMPMPRSNPIPEEAYLDSPELDQNPTKTLRVIKRNGSVTSFDTHKIAIALTKAFLAVEGGRAAESARVHELVENLANQVSEILHRRLSNHGTVHIEDIQDQAELALMRAGEHAVARNYVLYRESRKKIRDQNNAGPAVPGILRVKDKNGLLKALDTERLHILLTEACENLPEVNKQLIFEDTLKNLFEGI